MTVQSAGYYAYELNLLTTSGAGKSFVCCTEAIYDIGPLMRKLI
jgi:hypothetical protein